VIPDANLDYRSLHELYGAIVTRRLDFNSNAQIHYDEALGKVESFKGGVPYWTIKSWNQIIAD
jgi:hypothetical protein